MRTSVQPLTKENPLKVLVENMEKEVTFPLIYTRYRGEKFGIRTQDHKNM